MGHAISLIRRNLANVPVLSSAANIVVRIFRRPFWSLRPFNALALVPSGFLNMVCSELRGAESPFTLVEIGCADGAVLRELAFQFPNGHFIGIDIQRAAIERGRDIIAQSGISNVDLVRSSCLDSRHPLDCDYLISRTALIYLNRREIETFIGGCLSKVRRKLILQEIVSVSGSTEVSHFFAHPLEAIVLEIGRGEFSVDLQLLDYSPWKDPSGRWSGANIVVARVPTTPSV